MKWNKIREVPPPPYTDLLVGVDIYYRYKDYGCRASKFRAVAYIKDDHGGYEWRDTNDNNKLCFNPEFWAPIAPLPKDGE